jgi:DNA-directed RNA polymerase specialized sigma24 family protein
MEAIMSIFNFDDRRNRQAADRELAYATRSDFQRIFTEDMGALHLLAMLLTADAAKAEQCFVAGLEESIHGNPVFKEWARSWSKRVIIRNAIKLLSPLPAQAETSDSRPFAGYAPSEKDAWTATIMQLPAFERFVFVILVLEGHSESDCASLLGCSMQEMIRARSQALARVAAVRGSSVFQGVTCTGFPLRLTWAP